MPRKLKAARRATEGTRVNAVGQYRKGQQRTSNPPARGATLRAGALYPIVVRLREVDADRIVYGYLPLHAINCVDSALRRYRKRNGAGAAQAPVGETMTAGEEVVRNWTQNKRLTDGDLMQMIDGAIEAETEALREVLEMVAAKLRPIPPSHGTMCHVAGEPCWNCRTLPVIEAALARGKQG